MQPNYEVCCSLPVSMQGVSQSTAVSLLQSWRCIHPLEAMGEQGKLAGFSGLSCLFRAAIQRDKPKKPDEPNKPDEPDRYAPRMVPRGRFAVRNSECPRFLPRDNVYIHIRDAALYDSASRGVERFSLSRR